VVRMFRISVRFRPSPPNPNNFWIRSYKSHSPPVPAKVPAVLKLGSTHEVLRYYQGTSWVIVRNGIRLMIADRAFWITPATLETLRSKTLTLIQHEVGRGKCAGSNRPRGTNRLTRGLAGTLRANKTG
jgi:hypothetical protein